MCVVKLLIISLARSCLLPYRASLAYGPVHWQSPSKQIYMRRFRVPATLLFSRSKGALTYVTYLPGGGGMRCLCATSRKVAGTIPDGIIGIQ